MKPFPRPSAWQNVAKVIHPQLPLNQRQSQQLLELLRVAFQRKLDRAYPPLDKRTKSPVSAVGGRHTELDHEVKRPSISQGVSGSPLPSLATSRIVDDILSNALFSTKPNPSSFIFGEASTGMGADLPRTITLSDLDQVKRWFRGCLASGSVEVTTINKYLKIIHDALGMFYGTQKTHRLQEIGAGKDIMQWLGSSDHVLASFSMHGSGYVNLVKSLTAEGRLEDVQKILLLNFNGREPSSFDRCRTVLKTWYQSSYEYGFALEQRLQDYLSFLKALNSRVQLSDSLAPLKAGLSRILQPSATSFAIAVTAGKETVSEDLYNSFFRTVPLWKSPYSIGSALLSMYHPTQPDASQALLMTQRIEKDKIREWPNSVQRRLLKLCLDASTSLLAESRVDDGSKVLSFAKHHFAQWLDLEHDTESSHHTVASATAGHEARMAKSRQQQEFIYANFAMG